MAKCFAGGVRLDAPIHASALTQGHVKDSKLWLNLYAAVLAEAALVNLA